MTLKYKTKGFIFKKNDINESDRIFSVFTEDYGRLEIRGKAIRKINSKLRAGIDIFYISDIEFIQGKNYKTLTDACAIKKFKNVVCDFKTVNQISETLDKFIKGQEKDEKIFSLLSEIFEKISDTKKQDLIYYYFLWNFLSLQGYWSNSKNCISCQQKLNPYAVYFSGKEGGVICKKCLDKDNFAQKINSDIVKILRIILLKDWQTISKLKIESYSQKLLSEVSQNAINSFCPS